MRPSLLPAFAAPSPALATFAAFPRRHPTAASDEDDEEEEEEEEEGASLGRVDLLFPVAAALGGCSRTAALISGDTNGREKVLASVISTAVYERKD